MEAFKRHGADFVVADTLEELAAGLNHIGDADLPPIKVEVLDLAHRVVPADNFLADTPSGT